MTETKRSPREQAKREAIHAAAEHLFLHAGFEGASMDAIALEARVSKQTLYRYYQNKETLFVAVLSQLALQHLSERPWLSLRNTPMDSLPTLERALTRWAQEMIQQLMQPGYLGLLRLLIAELPRFPQLGALFTQAIPQQGGAYLKDLLMSAREQGIIEIDDLALSLRLLVGPLLTYVLGSGLMAPDNRPQAPSSEQVAALVRLALVGLASHEREQGNSRARHQ
jgi:TetR/AcrR family transcriptional regulator, mexJK operon transcriptional repressor